jgi:hypothetical protein
VALPFALKKYLKAKGELWKLKYFTMQKYIHLQKNPLKEIKILQDIIDSITNLKFQHKPKYHLSKILV